MERLGERSFRRRSIDRECHGFTERKRSHLPTLVATRAAANFRPRLPLPGILISQTDRSRRSEKKLRRERGIQIRERCDGKREAIARSAGRVRR
jgi:hypothetical protein